MRHVAALVVVVVLLALGVFIVNGPAGRYELPANSRQVAAGIYVVTVNRGWGLQGDEAAVYGFERRLLSRRRWRCEYPCTTYTFGRRADVSARWQAVLTTMQVGETKRVWIRNRLGFTEVYDVALMTAHRVDSGGEIIHEAGTGDATQHDTSRTSTR